MNDEPHTGVLDLIAAKLGDQLGELPLAGIGLCFIASVLSVIAGVGLVIWQAVNWLHSGEWDGPTIWTAIERLGPPDSFVGWLLAPESWLGLHRVVTRLLDQSLWSVLVLVGGAFTVLLFGPILDSAPRPTDDPLP